MVKESNNKNLTDDLQNPLPHQKHGSNELIKSRKKNQEPP